MLDAWWPEEQAGGRRQPKVKVYKAGSSAARPPGSARPRVGRRRFESEQMFHNVHVVSLARILKHSAPPASRLHVPHAIPLHLFLVKLLHSDALYRRQRVLTVVRQHVEKDSRRR